MIRKTLLFVLPFVLVACDAREAAETPEPDPIARRTAGALVLVDANGLNWKNDKGISHLNFGMPRKEVNVVLSSVFDTQPEMSSNEECGAGPMNLSQYGPLQIAFQDDKFVGWSLRAGEDVMTRDGVYPGMTVNALKSERQLRKINSAVPGEFEYITADYGTIRGFSQSGTIIALQAGVSCSPN